VDRSRFLPLRLRSGYGMEMPKVAADGSADSLREWQQRGGDCVRCSVRENIKAGN